MNGMKTMDLTAYQVCDVDIVTILKLCRPLAYNKLLTGNGSAIPLHNRR